MLLQRNELRRSRIELLSAQNEAQAAREETRKVRAELAEAQNQRSRAERQSKELQNLNRLLRTELTQSTQSFRQAMQTAQRFLIEGDPPDLLNRKGTQQQYTDSAGSVAPDHADAQFFIRLHGTFLLTPGKPSSLVPRAKIRSSQNFGRLVGCLPWH